MLRRLVLSFAGRSRSVGEVAAESGIELKRLHHHVTRLCRMGLLELVAQRRRRGRPIKLYRAAADSFFIPFDVAPALFTDALARELRDALRAKHLISEEGVLLSVDADGVPLMRFVADQVGSAKAAELWRVLRLDARQAAALRKDLEEVLERHAAAAAPDRGKPYLVHAALAQRLAPTVSVDNRRVDSQPRS